MSFPIAHNLIYACHVLFAPIINIDDSFSFYLALVV